MKKTVIKEEEIKWQILRLTIEIKFSKKLTDKVKLEALTELELITRNHSYAKQVDFYDFEKNLNPTKTSASEILLHLFFWEYSKSGHYFWDKIYKALK